jgi:hypothetical protein
MEEEIFVEPAFPRTPARSPGSAPTPDGRSPGARTIHHLSGGRWHARSVADVRRDVVRRDARRNDPCPCGSGRKFKRCCLVARDVAASDRRECEAMWERMQRWAFDRFKEELHEAFADHLKGRGVGTVERPADEDDMAASLGWVLLDRRLACGATPARLYAELPELPPRERWLAGRIAGSQLGVHRVLASEPGAWIELEDVLSGTRVRVDSPNVSLDAVRWTVLICRVERGGPVPALWGGAAFYEPHEEDEILEELRRIAHEHGLDTDAAGLAAALCAGAREMVCFMPPSRLAERTLCTLEGDPLVFAQATWRLADRDAALRALCATSEVALRPAGRDGRDGHERVFDWLALRRDLLARRPALPPGAVVIETTPLVHDERGELQGGETTSFGTLTVRGTLLELACLSEQRLDAAVALVERTLGPLAVHVGRQVCSFEEARNQLGGGSAGGRAETASRRRRAEPRGEADEPFDEADARLQALVCRRWMEDPSPFLDGLSPREAAGRPEHRERLERYVRMFEHQSARARHEPLPGPEAAWLRRELALDCEPAAR